MPDNVVTISPSPNVLENKHLRAQNACRGQGENI